MDNKDHLNQIPGENQDEKTSNSENQNVEASQQADNQVKAETDQADAEKPVSEELVDEAQEKALEKAAQPAQENETPTAADEQKTETVKEESVSAEDATTQSEAAPEQQQSEEEEPVAAQEPVIEEPSKPEAEAAESLENEQTSEPAAEKSKDDQPAPAPDTSASEAAGQDEEVVAETEAEQTPESADEKATAETEAEKTADSTEAAEESDDDEEDEHEDEQADIDLNTLSRQKLVEKLEEHVAEEDVNKIKSKVALIKLAYIKKAKEEKEEEIKAGLANKLDDDENVEETPQEEDPIDLKFNELFSIYRQKRAIFLENLEKEKQENLKIKQNILEELKALISSEETLKKTYDDFKSLQERWRDAGMVPKAEVNNLWQNYHFLVEKFFDKVKINKELKDLDLKKNLEQKIDLCEKAEELLLENSIIKSFKELQRLHDLWKEIGPVSSEKNDDIWERFKSATDKINQRRRDHYNKLQAEHEENLQQKVALCESAEQLLATEVNSLKDWQTKTNQFNELFKVWKTIGPASKKQNDEIWTRFRTSMDSFFKDKKEYFGKLKDQQINNYNLKLDLAIRAEAIKDSTDWRDTTKELINMQKEWKEIGPVPRKHSDKIWKRFRAACDEFFNNKSNHFSTVRNEENENMKKREELIKLVTEAKFDGEKSENLNKLKDFQRQWTEIGFVPFKEKDRLQSEFRNAVNKKLDELNISSTEISLAHYKSKIEVVKDSPEGNKSLSRERSFIQNKISKLRDDINVWENNIGFLANSKNANVFKEQFEKKIDAAKEELKTLEAKIKLIND
jgi:hypothetical protein